MAAKELINASFYPGSFYHYFRMEGNVNDTLGAASGMTGVSTSFDNAYGKFTQGVRMNGTTSTIKGNATQPTSSYSVVGWVRSTNSVADTNYRILDTQNDGGGSNGMTFAYNPNRDGDNSRRLRVYHNNGSWANSDDLGSVLEDGSLHHVAITWNGSTVRFYLDGVAVGVVSYSTSISNGGTIGVLTGKATATKWSGDGDDIAITEDVLTLAQIQELVGNAPTSGGNFLALF